MSVVPEYIVVGKVVGAHGVKGEVKLTLSIDDPAFLRTTKTLYIEGRQRKPLTVRSVRFHQNMALIAFESTPDRTAAESLRGRELSVPFDQLPVLEEDEFYVAQIIGLNVITEDGEALGKVVDVMFTGANEVYVVKGDKYGEVLIPALVSVIGTVDLEAGTMTVTLPEGLLGDEVITQE